MKTIEQINEDIEKLQAQIKALRDLARFHRKTWLINTTLRKEANRKTMKVLRLRKKIEKQTINN